MTFVEALRMPLSILLSLVLLASASAAAAQQKAAAPEPAKASPADFTKLRFLEGKWRGMSNGLPFFERYQFVDDSTISMMTSPDSTFATEQPGSKIVRRAGAIYLEEGESRSAVTRIDSAGYRFTSPNGQYWFVFKSESANTWTATLANGPVYRMSRVN